MRPFALRRSDMLPSTVERPQASGRAESSVSSVCWLLALLTVAPLTATTLSHGPSSEVASENQPEFLEKYRLRLHNSANGLIEASRDRGATWTVLGHILSPVTTVNRSGFTASRWAQDSAIAATAVNAIHVKVTNNPQSGAGVVFSFVPVEQGVTFKGGAAQTQLSSAARTNIPGGTVLFGGGWAPFINSPVFVERAGNLERLAPEFSPKDSDVFVVVVQRPAKYPVEMTIENRFGGLITIRYSGEEPRVIGQVLRPVLGVGRFEGSFFAAVGRIRANHPGVIDVSTSPYHEHGGFQIIPANHAMSPEMTYARRHTQWMVVGPLNGLDPSWEGTAPLYSYFLQPSYDPKGFFTENWPESLLSRFRVEVKLKDGDPWQRMVEYAVDPKAPLPEEAFTALKDVKALRIVFPFPLEFLNEGR